ncbi:MAG: tRNA (guanine(10)-N(2))-dimethyltransferase [Thermoplasmatota archaeon]
MNQKYKLITEGTTQVYVFHTKTTHKGPASKEKQPFYNPSMQQNRDLSIVVNQYLLSKAKKSLDLLDGLAASGIRGIRYAKELKGKYTITINDANTQAFTLIKKNIAHNKISNITASNQNLHTLLSQKHYDSIDIDPYGSPIYYFDSAMRSIRRNGMISCTATDTATLCGVYPKVCYRRYGARPLHSTPMHEIGLRILLGCLCKEAAKYDKAIQPILSYSTDHYMRIYIQIQRGKQFANNSINLYGYIEPKNIMLKPPKNQQCIGPLWLGPLHSKKAIQEIRTLILNKELNTKNTLYHLLYLLEEEADAPPFFYNTDDIASYLKMSVPSKDKIFQKIQEKGYSASPTHFSTTGFKTNASIKEIKQIFKEEKTSQE